MPAPAAQFPLPDGLGSVLDALPVGLYVVDRDLRVVAWNRLREQGTQGRRGARMIGKPLSRALGAAGFRATGPVLREIFKTGKPHEEIVETARVYHVRRLPVRRGRKVTHVLSWFEDITERRRLEMRLIAQDRYTFLGQFVTGVAQEISNPLAGIAGCAEALSSLAVRGDRTSKREARQFRDLIRTEVARCENIVRSVFDASQPSTRPVADVGETVAQALALLERHPTFSRTRVRKSLPKLPLARLDADSLKQVVMALASGASQAMGAGGTVSVRSGRQGKNLVLDVSDTAPPVPLAERARLFEPFSAEEIQKRSGLGLAIARSLLRSRGGDLVYRPRKTGNAFRAILRVAPGKE